MRDALQETAPRCVSGEGESFKGERKKEATIPAPGQLEICQIPCLKTHAEFGGQYRKARN
jgi:hypothetical protein